MSAVSSWCMWKVKRWKVTGRHAEIFRGCWLPNLEFCPVKLPRPRINNLCPTRQVHDKVMSCVDVAKKAAAHCAVNNYVKVGVVF